MYKTSHLVIVFIIGIFLGGCFALYGVQNAHAQTPVIEYGMGAPGSQSVSGRTWEGASSCCSAGQGAEVGFQFTPGTDYMDVDYIGMSILRGGSVTNTGSYQMRVYNVTVSSSSPSLVAISSDIPIASPTTAGEDQFGRRCNGSSAGTQDPPLTSDSNCLTYFDFSGFDLVSGQTYWFLYHTIGANSGDTNNYYGHYTRTGTATYPTVSVSGDWATRATAGNSPVIFMYSNAIAPPSATAITAVNSPTNGGITASTSVSFDVDYISNYPVPSEICLFLVDLTAGQNLVPKCDPITTSGNLNFATTTVLTEEHWYQGTVSIRDEEGSVINSRLFTFHVVDNPYVTWAPPDPTIPSENSASSTDASLPDWLGRIMNLDNALANKHPWAWVIDFGQVLYETTTEPPTDVSAPLLILDLAISNSTSSMFYVNIDTSDMEMDMFSSTTVGSLMPVDTIRELIRFALWLLFMFYLFRMTQNIFNRA